MDHTARTARTAKRPEGRKERGISFLSVFSVLSVLWVICLATTPAQSGPAPWPQVYDGLADSLRKILYAGACDFSVPAFADIDGDGDLDLFVGQDEGFPIFLRNDGTARAPEWTFISQFYDLPALSPTSSRATPAFADVDGDGTIDLALGLANGRIAYYHNKGTSTRAEWELVSQDWVGRAVSTNARPAFADIDADGDLDLFVGGQDGCIAFFRNDGTPQSPSWSYVLGNFMSIDVGGAASPAFCDIDGDGDYDLFVGNALGRVYFYRNFGTPQLGFFTLGSNHYAGLDVPKNAAPALADLDQDGRYDLFAGSFSGAIAWLANQGTVEAPQWGAPASVWLGLDAGSNSAAELADIDGDGNPDLFLAATNTATTAGYAIQRYRNDGAPWLPNWRLADRQFAGIQIADPVPRFVDIDGDGDLDLFVGDTDGVIHFFRNRGTPQVSILAEETTGSLTLGGAFGAMWASPCFSDFDGDGDYDLLAGYLDFGVLDGAVAYYENIGSPAAPTWAAPQDWSAEMASDELPTVAAGDVDGDGRPDVVVGSMGGGVFLHRCLQTTPTLSFDAAVQLDFVSEEPFAVPALADVDGDLRPDLLLGGTYGGARLYRNPGANLTILPNHKTVAAGAGIDFTTSETVSGAWQIIANRSGASINPATGRYTAGSAPGVDAVRFGDTLTSCGVAYVNVLTPGQMSATGKAIIMAGRKSNDPLWNATNSLANSVYRLLLFKGYPKESLCYLNPDPSQDVDGNGLPDDIAAPSGLDAMEAAMTGWARGASGLVVYLIDHGQEESRSPYVRCNESEVLHASVLNPWLNGLQDSGMGLVTLVVDCCQSGGFLRDCHGGPGRPRVVIGSAAATEPAWFSAGGLISFSNAFVSSLYAGLNVGDAFAIAAAGMDPYQRPQLDDDGDGVYRPGVDGALACSATLGAADVAGADRPRLGLVCANQTLTSGAAPVTIWVSETCSVHPLDRVWAAIAPPRLSPEAATRPGDPVLDTPELDLAWDAASHRYEATTNTFTQLGAYRVSVYARDIWGGVSYPKQTYVNQRLADERMIIVCCDSDYDADSPAALSSYVANTAYGTARARWLEDGDITYLTPFAALGKDGPPNKSALEAAIAGADGAGQLTVFLIGGANGAALRLCAGDLSENLTAQELGAWLDGLQAGGSTRVVAVLDFTHSGDWLTSLTAPLGKERVAIASCGRDETSWCEQGGALCFSQYYFSKMREGANARDAFHWARAAMRAVTHESQSARLDDDGSGSAAKHDGALAARTYLGAAYAPEVEAPVIGACARDVVLTSSSATLWASGVWDRDGIARVFAQVVPPGATATSGQTEEVELLYSSSMARWQADYACFDPSANQSVIYFAQDRTGQLSPPYVATFGPAFGGRDDVYDRFYADDTTGTLNFISRGGDVQVHNFWAPGDEDWAVFSADAHSLYTIQVTDQAANCDAIIYLYEESDLQTPVAARDDHWAGGEDEVISWDSGTYTGAVFVKVSQSPDALELGGNATTYTLRISGDWGDNSGLATISPTTMASIGPSGGTLSAGAGGVYTQHSVSVPAGAMSDTADFIMDSTGDVGNSPYYAYTRAWLSAHPHNASLCQVSCAAPVTLSSDATIAIEFLNDATVFPGFPIDDKPSGVDPNDMRIYTWTGSAWSQLPGSQTVFWDSGTAKGTVTGSVSALGSVGHELGFSISLFAVAPGDATPTTSPTPSPTPSPTASPTASSSPLPSPSPSPFPSPTAAPTPTATSSPSPTLSPSPTPVPTPSASRISDNLLGQGDLSEAEKKAADVNKDGKLDIADVISWINDHATTPTAPVRRSKASGH